MLFRSAKEFHDTKECHKGWSKIRKNAFVDELYDIAAQFVSVGINISCKKKSYRDSQNKPRGNKWMSAYGYAFGTILHTIARGSPLSEIAQSSGLSVIVESGHNNNNEIAKFFNKVKDQDIYKGILKSFTFSGKEDSRAIQLADFYAFYSRRHAARLESHLGKKDMKPEPMYLRFVDRFPHWGYTVTDPYSKSYENWWDADYDPNKNYWFDMPSI